ncbi:MAG TPA: alpha-L-rhamnosidase N-terminal domain-containing protein, partial [Candidatus Acidoferrales bacterium]|nr:alpha-L-rhamnosidase N-terminal domain-containing protein [Candidatus Acidoferrales bacterium]
MNFRFRACVMECGGKRSATPLSKSWRRGRFLRCLAFDVLIAGGAATSMFNSPWKFVSLLITLITLITLTASAKPSAPVSLLVNGVNNPLAIDRDTTRFTWMSKDSERGERQTACQIIVFKQSASTLQRFNASTLIWDSGKVNSDKSAAVEYGGKALPAATQFWWKVRIWDQTGKASPYSAPAYFDTGLNQNEWTAHYIWDGTTNQNNFAYFRKMFLLTNNPTLVKVYVTAHNDYLLFCNGHVLGRGPARCNPYSYGQYNAYDVTALLRRGTNAFAAIGHWSGNWHNNVGINAQPAFLLQARLDFSDGSFTSIRTDESWKATAHTAFVETNVTYFGAGSDNR